MLNWILCLTKIVVTNIFCKKRCDNHSKHLKFGCGHPFDTWFDKPSFRYLNIASICFAEARSSSLFCYAGWQITVLTNQFINHSFQCTILGFRKNSFRILGYGACRKLYIQQSVGTVHQFSPTYSIGDVTLQRRCWNKIDNNLSQLF